MNGTEREDRAYVAYWMFRSCITDLLLNQ